MGSQKQILSSGLEDTSQDIFLAPVRHFHAGVCFTCYCFPTEEKHLMKCSQCQLVSYCSKPCQKSDWRTHK